MSAYVVLTAFLFQRGSAESNDPDASKNGIKTACSDESELRERVLAPVRAGGWARTVYSYSLGIALFALFLLSFLLHLRNSAADDAAEAILHGKTPPTVIDHLVSAQFWFESCQNWQSEFLSTAVIVVLSIFLRFRGSPESKPVDAPHSQTGA